MQCQVTAEASGQHGRSRTARGCRPGNAPAHHARGVLRRCPQHNAEAPGDVAGRGLRSFTYQAVGQLAARAPQLLAGDVSIAARFFQVLSRCCNAIVHGAVACCKSASAASLTDAPIQILPSFTVPFWHCLPVLWCEVPQLTVSDFRGMSIRAVALAGTCHGAGRGACGCAGGRQLPGRGVQRLHR